MTSQYHAGELAVQSQAGVQEMAARVIKSIHPTLPPVAQTFLGNQRMVAVSTTDASGNV